MIVLGFLMFSKKTHQRQVIYCKSSRFLNPSLDFHGLQLFSFFFLKKTWSLKVNFNLHFSNLQWVGGRDLRHTHTLTMLYTYKLQCMMGNSFSYVHTLGRVHPIREQRVHRLEPIGSVYISMMLYRTQWGQNPSELNFKRHTLGPWLLQIWQLRFSLVHAVLNSRKIWLVWF